MQERQAKIPTTADSKRQNTRVHPDPRDVIAFVSELASRYELTALEPLLRVCHSAVMATDLNIAILGRFKAGKSSFLNHFVGRDLLPVGVVPVTTVITEVHWAPQDEAEVHFLDDRVEPIQFERVGEFIAESKNPENRKGVRAVCVRIPELAPYKVWALSILQAWRVHLPTTPKHRSLGLPMLI